MLALGLAGSAGGASRAKPAKITAYLTATSFTSSQASSVKLVYGFSKPSRGFSYRLSIKEGKKWRLVKRVKMVKKKGYFKGQRTSTVKKLFAGKPIKVGSYRLKLSVAEESKRLGFKVLGPGPASTRLSAGSFHTCVISSAGAVKCWGSNEHGQLGDVARTSSRIPVSVVGIP